MSKQLFLTSYLAGTKLLFQSFISPLKDKRVLFIPTASNVEEYTAYVDEALGVFQEMNFDVHILDIANTDKTDIISALNDFPCLYISGGNTFYLLQELKKKGLIEIIKEKVLANLIYIGESAGAIILSKNIAYIQLLDDKNKATELDDYLGLDLTDFYILPHYNEIPFAESGNKTIQKYKNNLNLLPINNHQAVIVNGKNYELYE